MNNERRRRIRKIIKELHLPDVDIEAMADDIQELADEEEEAMDNMPESMQETERYQIAEESLDLLIDAVDTLDPDDEDSVIEAIKILKKIDGV